MIKFFRKKAQIGMLGKIVLIVAGMLVLFLIILVASKGINSVLPFLIF
jgi:hypothetical protein